MKILVYIDKDNIIDLPKNFINDKYYGYEVKIDYPANKGIEFINDKNVITNEYLVYSTINEILDFSSCNLLRTKTFDYTNKDGMMKELIEVEVKNCNWSNFKSFRRRGIINEILNPVF